MHDLANRGEVVCERQRQARPVRLQLHESDPEMGDERGALEPSAGQGGAVDRRVSVIGLLRFRHGRGRLASYPVTHGHGHQERRGSLRVGQAGIRRPGDRLRGDRNAALARLGQLLKERTGEVLEANAADLADERAAGLTEALRDRLTLSEEPGGGDVRGSARDRRCSPTLWGRCSKSARWPAACELKKVRVPLGVIAVIYEARPNVTVDCAALALKSGNAIVLRGSELRGALERGTRRGGARGGGRGGAPGGSVELLDAGDRAELAALATAGGPRRPDHPAGR